MVFRHPNRFRDASQRILGHHLVSRFAKDEADAGLIVGMPQQLVDGTPNTESAMLARILQAGEQELTLDAAGYWLSVKLPASDQNRVDELSAKARAGSLTEVETQELDNYLHIGFLLGTMQAKARRLIPTESALTPQ